jgi:hypothetical protein
MKLKIEFTKEEAIALAKVTKAYDFANHINTDLLSKKYAEGNSAGSFKYSGITDEGAKIKFETNEKLLLAAAGVYLKYSDSVNGIICGIKSLVVSFKGLLNNFISDYNKEIGKVFEECKKEDEEKKKVQDLFKEIKDLSKDDDK